MYAIEEDYAPIQAAASASVAASGGPSAIFPGADAPHARTAADLRRAAGEYEWLWLYFDEVIWPEAESVQRHVRELQCASAARVHVVDGDLAPVQVEAATRRVIAKALR